MQGDLLVHVLEEMQDAREVVVDHEVLDPVEQDDGSGSVGHEVRDQVAQAVQVVRIDVVLPSVVESQTTRMSLSPRRRTMWFGCWRVMYIGRQPASTACWNAARAFSGFFSFIR